MIEGDGSIIWRCTREEGSKWQTTPGMPGSLASVTAHGRNHHLAGLPYWLDIQQHLQKQGYIKS